MYNVQIAPLERWIITTIKSSIVIWLYFNLEKNDLGGCDWFLMGYVRPGFDSLVWVIELCRPPPTAWQVFSTTLFHHMNCVNPIWGWVEEHEDIFQFGFRWIFYLPFCLVRSSNREKNPQEVFCIATQKVISDQWSLRLNSIPPRLSIWNSLSVETVPVGSVVHRKPVTQYVFYYTPQWSRKGEAHVAYKHNQRLFIFFIFFPF